MTAKTIGHYEIIEQVGAGGMGEVYRARDSKLGRDVALKVLPPDFANDPERLARFEREARLLASLNHPNVAVIHGFESHGGTHVLVMELIHGEDLAHRIERGATPVEEALTIMKQVAEGLSAAHDSGIFHRDLKPANIRVTPEGIAKVLDFGLAKSDPASSGSFELSHSPTITHDPTMAGVILGTAAYMSPEQARGKPVDRRADIFAFGAVMFEMLTGQRVFSGETVSDTLAAVLRADADWDALPKDTPRAIRRLLERCLEKDRRQRLQDIGEARITIERVMAGEADDVGPADDTNAQPSRRKFWIGVVTAFAAAFIAGQVINLGGAKDTSDSSTGPVVKFQFAVEKPGFMHETFSPDGNRLLYSDDNRLWIRDLDRFESRPIPGSEGMYIAAFSPDGKSIAATDGPRLFRMPVEGGSKTKLTNLPESMHAFASGIVWTDEDEIVFLRGSSGIYKLPASGGDPQTWMEIEEGYEDYHHLKQLPDGSLLYVIHEPNAYTKLGVCKGGVGRVILDEPVNLGYPCYSPTGHIVYQRMDGTEGLWAVPFAVDKLEVTGEPFLVAPDAGEPDVSPTGTLAYLWTPANVPSHLIWFTRDGVAVDTIATTSRGRDTNMGVSPDGRLLATSETADENRDIWLYNLVDGTERRLTTEEGADWSPSFSPDGKTILYTHGSNAGDREVRVRPVDGRGSFKTLTNGSVATFSPDGKWVVFEHAGKNYRQNLHYMPADGSAEPTVLLSSPLSMGDPQFSPDGRFLAFVKNDATNQIYLVSFPDGANSWQVTIDGGADPRWSAHSDRLFYVKDDMVMEVTIETSPAVRIGTPREVVAREAVDPLDTHVWASPDGKHVLVQRALDARSARPSIRIVQKWYAEFAR